MDAEQTRVAQQVLVASPAILGTLADYRAWLGGRKVRKRAVDTFAREVRAFAVWLGDGALVVDMTEGSIDRYQATIAHLAPSTVGKKLSALRSYVRFCLRRKLRTDDPTLDLDWPRRRKRLPRPLKAEELQQLEDILERPAPVLDRKARRLWFRNRRIVLLLLYTGLRRSEVAGLLWADVYLTERFLIVREETAKGGNERTVVIHSRLVKELQRTPVRERRGAVAGHKDGRCLSHKSIGHIFERWLADEGLRISAHRLRHTNATEQLRSGAKMHQIQANLGHSDIRTTQGYLGPMPDLQRSAIDGLPDRFG